MSKLSKAYDHMKNEMNEMKEFCKKQIVEEDLLDDPDAMVALARSFRLMDVCEEMLAAYITEIEQMSIGIELILAKLETIENK